MSINNVYPRSIIATSLILFMTSGLYAWICILFVLNDLNKISDRKVFPVMAISLYFLSLFIIYLLIIFMPPGLRVHAESPPYTVFYIMIFIALILVFSLYISILLANRYIRKISGENGGVVDDLILFFLMLFMMASIPLVQHRLNKFLRARH